MPDVCELAREPFFALLVFLLGLCLGSFLNVVIHRLPRRISLLRPRSHCPACGAFVRPWHNLPVAGWILLRGRCADCRVRISARYPLVEISGGLLALAAVYAVPAASKGEGLAAGRWVVQSFSALWLFFSLLAVFFIDWEHRIIPDEISLGGAALGLAL
jgi:leader peptidase (prepilin peptidase) / N-methyltransferase